MENLEAEALGIITSEALAVNKNTYEIDTTGLTGKEIANRIIHITKGKVKDHLPGKIDWSEKILGWY